MQCHDSEKIFSLLSLKCHDFKEMLRLSKCDVATLGKCRHFEDVMLQL